MKYLLVVLLWTFAQGISCQHLVTLWTFEAGSRFFADPVTEGERVFIGSEQGVMYALDVTSGKVIWEYDTEGHIKAAVAINDQLVFFESANKIYALDKESGNLQWLFDPEIAPRQFTYEDRTFKFQLDFFDDIRSAPVLHEESLFIGSSRNEVWQLEVKTGKLIHSFPAQDHAAVRTTPLINQGRLYFGDWNGWVYAYDLITREKQWQRKTYRGSAPYSTFGGVISSVIEYQDLLFFGARNYQVNVLLAESGEKEWTYTDPQGGWICADPIVYQDTLYWGGSDNFSMYAFNPLLGSKIWEHVGTLNILKAPVVTDNWVIYGAGNWYNSRQPGYIQILDRKQGVPLTQFVTDQAVFSRPVLNGDILVFGSVDGKVHALNLKP